MGNSSVVKSSSHLSGFYLFFNYKDILRICQIIKRKKVFNVKMKKAKNKKLSKLHQNDIEEITVPH
jgi:hypothetical protein